jgi:hypothetical protein
MPTYCINHFILMRSEGSGECLEGITRHVHLGSYNYSRVLVTKFANLVVTIFLLLFSSLVVAINFVSDGFHLLYAWCLQFIFGAVLIMKCYSLWLECYFSCSGYLILRRWLQLYFERG